jgi:hypothetical protein
MAIEFKDLKALAEEDFRLAISEVLAARTRQYQDVNPEEIFDLLEEAAETYAFVAPTLSPHQRNSSRQEIEFFLSLYLDSLKNSFRPQKPQLPQKLLQNSDFRNFLVTGGS